jgi:hypothetical protein
METHSLRIRFLEATANVEEKLGQRRSGRSDFHGQEDARNAVTKVGIDSDAGENEERGDYG